jgi:hypothetical protein
MLAEQEAFVNDVTASEAQDIEVQIAELCCTQDCLALPVRHVQAKNHRHLKKLRATKGESEMMKYPEIIAFRQWTGIVGLGGPRLGFT